MSEEYADIFYFDVLSGRMITGHREGFPKPQLSKYIVDAIPTLEEHAGIKFGEAYKQQIASGTLYQSSLKPAIALCVLKAFDQQYAVAFASALQHEQFMHGKSLEHDETYRHLAKQFSIDEAEFLHKLHSNEFKSTATDEFKFVQQLGVTGFPALVAIHRKKLYWVSREFQSYVKLKPVFEQLKTLD